MNGPVFLLLVGVGGALIPVFELTQRKQSMKDCGRSTRGVAGGTPLACSASSLSEAVVRQRSRSRPDAPVGMSAPGHLHRVVGVRELMRQRRSPTILATATTRPAVTPRWGTYSRVSLPPATTSNAVYNLANRLTPWNGAVVSRQQLEPDLRRARSPTRTTPQPAHPGSSRKPEPGEYLYDGLGRRISRKIAISTTKPGLRGVEPAAGAGQQQQRLGQLP
jgi:hypothetical protein